MAADILIGGSPDGPVIMALKRANRHGLIAGATGTGKTVTLQTLAESFSREGVAVFAADVKGDLSGIAAPGAPPPGWAVERAKQIGLADYTPSAPPVVFWDLYGQQGHPIRTTLTEMGPVLIGRILEATDAQEGALAVAFKLADDWLKAGKQEGLLLNLADLRSMLNYISDNADDIGKAYGLVSPTTVAALQRKLLQLEGDGAESFFGEPALQLADMIRTTADGRGVVNILAADKLVQSPGLYSTFLLWLMSELWEELPEVGDLDKPKMVFFFDEAHLLFRDAEKTLLGRIEQVARLIRSKGVGLYFITQSPTDVPDIVLSQLGNRFQHALRAYTPADQKAVKAAAQSFRAPEGLDVYKTIQELGVGEALVSTLDAKGAPTPVAKTAIAPPHSRVGPVTGAERAAIIAASGLGLKYDKAVDRQSAYEILSGKASAAAQAAEAQEAEEAANKQAAAKAKADQAAAMAQAKAGAASAKAAATQAAAEARAAAAQAKLDAQKQAASNRGMATIEKTAAQVGGRVLSNVGSALAREVMRGIFGNMRRR
ncbi:MAG TPA: helicase HerA-like domain-containing protein [Caulobacterales bacterium]|nr:helicase HerA-like domain-containing protein [Caulobacterales bacterium]